MLLTCRFALISCLAIELTLGLEQSIRAGSEKSDSRYKWNSCLTLA